MFNFSASLRELEKSIERRIARDGSQKGKKDKERNKSKGKIFPVHALKASRGSRGMAPLILNPNARWR
jgi:hypothetical protein